MNLQQNYKRLPSIALHFTVKKHKESEDALQNFQIKLNPVEFDDESPTKLNTSKDRSFKEEVIIFVLLDKTIGKELLSLSQRRAFPTFD